MSPLRMVLPKGKTRYIQLRPSGELIIPAHIIRRCDWRLGIKLSVNYFDAPLVLFLSTSKDDVGYTLHDVGHEGSDNASKLRISKLTNDELRMRVKLPLRGLESVHMPQSTIHDLELAIPLEPWNWTVTTFDVAGAESIPPKLIGLYSILSGDGRVLKIGEGQIMARMKEAMKITELARQGRVFRYMSLEKDDAELLEQLALAEHRGRYGELPPFNPINQ